MRAGEALATLNAALNGTSAVLIVLGWRAVRAGRTAAHHARMQAAFAVSAAFLVSYLARVAIAGTHRYPGTGPARIAYLSVLGSHTALAMVALPLVVRTLWLGRRGRTADHRRIARFALPVWLYVSVTGVVVYVMLYRI